MNCKYSVLIVAGAVVLIPPADKPERYQDLINSLLLAQLAANKKLEKDPGIGWYDVYMEFLDKYWLRHFRARLDLSVAQGNSVSVVDWVVAPEFGVLWSNVALRTQSCVDWQHFPQASRH